MTDDDDDADNGGNLSHEVRIGIYIVPMVCVFGPL